MSNSSNGMNTLGVNTKNAASGLIFVALAIVYLWFGYMKFADPNAPESMSGMLSANPLVSWLYLFLSKGQAVYFLGSMEIFIGVMIISRFINPRMSALGGLLSMALFIVTITMMIFLPSGVVAPSGFPTITFLGEFLLKDIVLFSASMYVFGHSLTLINKSALE